MKNNKKNNRFFIEFDGFNCTFTGIVDINCTWYGIYERKSFLYARTAGKR